MAIIISLGPLIRIYKYIKLPIYKAAEDEVGRIKRKTGMDVIIVDECGKDSSGTSLCNCMIVESDCSKSTLLN